MKSKKTISRIILGVFFVSQISMNPFNGSTYALSNTKEEKNIKRNIAYNQYTGIATAIQNVFLKSSVEDESEKVIRMPEDTITTTLGKTIKISPIIDETLNVEEYQWYKDDTILEGKTESELELQDITDETEGRYTLKIKAIVEENEEEYEASCNVIVASFTTSMTKKPETTHVGEKFEITLRIDSLKNVENGITCLGGRLNFDSNILEEVKIIVEEGWAKDEKFNEESLKFITDGDDTMTEASDIFKIQFKVKDDIEIEDKITTEISIQSIEASNGAMDIKSEDATIDVDIYIKPEDSVTSEKYEVEDMYISRIESETTIEKFKENIDSNVELEISDKKGNPLTDTDIVKTGTKLKAGKLEFTLIVTGDINEDGNVGVTDLAKLKAHYIEIVEDILTGINLKAADMNGDGEITITDLAQIKERIIK